PQQRHTSNCLLTRLKPHIAFVIYDGMTGTGSDSPVEVLANSHFNVDFVWRDKNPVFAENRANRQLGFLPTATFNELQHTDILFVPGTSNPYLQMRQQDMVDWVAQVGAHAKWVTSVCSGSFILGAAGLLKGYQATSHWALRDNCVISVHNLWHSGLYVTVTG
ncbi:MAG: DJ-1/PfpI family protein, partial [Shewanella fodinae]|nr:DJ-1/PfpI family protein [Shewanella fodinae]